MRLTRLRRSIDQGLFPSSESPNKSSTSTKSMRRRYGTDTKRKAKKTKNILVHDGNEDEHDEDTNMPLPGLQHSPVNWNTNVQYQYGIEGSLVGLTSLGQAYGEPELQRSNTLGSEIPIDPELLTAFAPLPSNRSSYKPFYSSAISETASKLLHDGRTQMSNHPQTTHPRSGHTHHVGHLQPMNPTFSPLRSKLCTTYISDSDMDPMLHQPHYFHMSLSNTTYSEEVHTRSSSGGHTNTEESSPFPHKSDPSGKSIVTPTPISMININDGWLEPRNSTSFPGIQADALVRKRTLRTTRRPPQRLGHPPDATQEVIVLDSDDEGVESEDTEGSSSRDGNYAE